MKPLQRSMSYAPGYRKAGSLLAEEILKTFKSQVLTPAVSSVTILRNAQSQKEAVNISKYQEALNGSILFTTGESTQLRHLATRLPADDQHQDILGYFDD